MTFWTILKVFINSNLFLQLQHVISPQIVIMNKFHYNPGWTRRRHPPVHPPSQIWPGETHPPLLERDETRCSTGRINLSSWLRVLAVPPPSTSFWTSKASMKNPAVFLLTSAVYFQFWINPSITLITLQSIQAYMPYKSSDDTSNIHVDHIFSPRSPNWPLGLFGRPSWPPWTPQHPPWPGSGTWIFKCQVFCVRWHERWASGVSLKRVIKMQFRNAYFRLLVLILREALEALDGEGEWHQRCQKEKQQHCPAFEHLERQMLS